MYFYTAVLVSLSFFFKSSLRLNLINMLYCYCSYSDIIRYLCKLQSLCYELDMYFKVMMLLTFLNLRFPIHSFYYNLQMFFFYSGNQSYNKLSNLLTFLHDRWSYSCVNNDALVTNKLQGIPPRV